MATKRQLIDTLFKIRDLDKSYTEGLNFTFTLLASRYSQLPQSFFDQLRSEVGIEYYLEGLKLAFEQNFNEQELQELVKFWSSPLGIKSTRGNLDEDIKRFSANWSLIVERLCVTESTKENK